MSNSDVCPTSLLSESVIFGDAFDDLEEIETDEDEYDDEDDEMESGGETDQSWETDSGQSDDEREKELRARFDIPGRVANSKQMLYMRYARFRRKIEIFGQKSNDTKV